MATKRRGSARQTTPGPAVPMELRRLWGIPRLSGRGRPPELDLKRVVRTAVRLADRHGLAGVSLPRIAKALGFTTMALYRHVGGKDELLSLMRDFGAGAPPEIDVPAAEWREGLRQWARAERRLLQQRGWLARLPIARPSGPNEIAWVDAALRVLGGTGLDWAEKVGILTLISGFVRHDTQLSQDLTRGRDATKLDKARDEQRYGRSLLALVDPARFPEASRLFASGVFEPSTAHTRNDPADDPDFVFGLERILDGAEAAIRHAGAPGAAPRRRGAPPR